MYARVSLKGGGRMKHQKNGALATGVVQKLKRNTVRKFCYKEWYFKYHIRLSALSVWKIFERFMRNEEH